MPNTEKAYAVTNAVPSLVVAADWSTDEKKRWMVRAERLDSGAYLVWPPEPVGDTASLVARLRGQLSNNESLLIGFDFPIGLSVAYAQRTDLSSFREALSQFGGGPWENFYSISDSPSLRQPFFPLPTQQRGDYRSRLAKALGFKHLSELRRRCELRTATRKAAECLFYTLGGAQVGAGAIVGWREVLQPVLGSVNLWPFDGELATLLRRPGVTIVEIYPAEAYSHVGVRIGSETGRTKTARDDRKEATRGWLADFGAGQIRLSNAARSWLDWGFSTEDDFDAMAGLLSMLLVVTGQRSGDAPKTDDVRRIEGWILGQEFTSLDRSGGPTSD
jgi:hypothetical protein